MNIFFYFLTPFLMGIMIIPLLLKFSKKTNFLVDVPEGDVLKIHKKNIPLLGGLAMLVASAIGVVGMGAWEMIPIFAALLSVFLLGFWDDLKWKHVSTTKPLLKFSLLIVCTLAPSIILSFAGISFNFIPSTIIAIVSGFVYIFICINAVNYQDGMDGLAGGLVSISLAGFLYLGLVEDLSLAVVVSLIFLGALTAFLQFNYPPAKVFMGDSGAYLLGFILAVLAMIFSKPFNMYSVMGPIFIIGLPIFDGVFTNIRRLGAGKSIFLGDRSHFYDRLLQKGFSTKKTLLICYLLQIVLVLIGVSIYA